MSEALAYENGALRTQSQVTIPLHDAGFVYGATVTDLCRTFGHRLFRWGDHLRRFRESCALARVPLATDDAALTQTAEALVRHNAALLSPEQELALVLLATPGEIGYLAGELGGPGDGTPRLLMHTFPLPTARYTRLWREGAVLVTPAVRHLPATCLPPQIKHRSRLFWWLAEREVKQVDPRASALLLDPDGLVTETAAANFLMIRGGRVLSPPRSRVLNGVSLQVTQELCREQGIPFQETDLRVADLDTADEALLTCTTFCLAPVQRVNSRALACPGPVYQRLLAAWNRHAGRDITA